ncbi:histidine decarboxylase [Streptomyces sp. NPDC020362]|uniref:histidine decarboxylase n=1 Tax=unclassified Streptomyces TaxID=2593676 RepID=UPI000AF923A9
MTVDQSGPQAVADFPFGPAHETWEEILQSQGLHNGQAGLVSGPIKNPAHEYPEEPGIDARDFQIAGHALTEVQRRKALDAMEKYLTYKRDHMLGYQFSQDTDGSRRDLSRFLDFNVNNMGDPFDRGGYKPNTRVAERAVLDYYASLWHAQWPHNPKDGESYWGYMTSMGSTEANLYALWNARDYLSGKALLKTTSDGGETLTYVEPETSAKDEKFFTPVVFYSQDTHYSFGKGMRVLGMYNVYGAAQKFKYIKEKCPIDGGWESCRDGVPSNANGEVDIEKLVSLVGFFAKHGHPILVSLNYGSTFKGAHDNVEEVCSKLLPLFKDKHLEHELTYGSKKKVTRRRFWIHVDGALGAGYGPFMRMASAEPHVFHWTPEVKLPEFDFGLKAKTNKGKIVDMVSSISMSGHKWPGVPWPCSLYMTKVKYQMAPPAEVPVIGSKDTTFAGSRNGFSPLVMWNQLAQLSYSDQVERCRIAMELAEYMESRLKELDITPALEVARTPGSFSVRFRRPNARLLAKWSMSEVGDHVHAFVMPSTTREEIDELVYDLQTSDAFIEPAPPIRLKDSLEAQLAALPAVDLADGFISLGGVPLSGRGME